MMSTVLNAVLAASLLLYPFAVVADTGYGMQQEVQTQQAPPVAQTLIREGDFAVKLASQLGLGSPSDETAAEDMLIRAGIAPVNGWISDYPVTPEIVGQLNDSVSKAAAEGKLSMSSDKAQETLASLVTEMGLPLPGGSGSAAESAQPYDSTVLGDYYSDQGPPIITYYPPPPAYGYLYDWVPYPVVWFGFAFPGFFICHSFTTVVVAPGPFGHGHFHGRIVSNHVFDPAARRSAVVDPVPRSNGSGMSLRTESGRSFRNASEWRKGMGAEHSLSSPPSRITGFGSAEARRSAGAIQERGAGRPLSLSRNFGQQAPLSRNQGQSFQPFGSRTPMQNSTRPPGSMNRSFSGGSGRAAGGFGGHAGGFGGGHMSGLGGGHIGGGHMSGGGR